ncbi:sodium- and chloride-dependent glycine transporter 1-like [Haliotis cracherodii]|uniref:sodium- and chloride-dependent glycine transporter 1-like n=1 Tax=Haliotis cracherodii TaxID=6455 RepID=UPI0039E776BC
MPEEREGPKRETWLQKREYILSMLGCSVGFGSFWRFPYLCNRNGGGAFFIPYFTAIIACGVPLFFLEVSISQFSSRSDSHVWVLCPLFKGIGISQLLTNIIGIKPYTLTMAWAIYYMSQSFRSSLPWTTCDNWWNTPVCINKVTNGSSEVFNSTVEQQLLQNAVWRKTNSTLTASEEFWQFNALRVSAGIDNFGSVQPHIILSLLCSWTALFLCLMKGVQSVGKVVYVTALMSYVLLTVLLVRSCMMPGSSDGLLYFIRPDFSRLGSVQVWLEALLQACYSMGTTFGSLITISSYNKFHNNCHRDVTLLTIVGEASTIFCGLVVFSSLGFMAHKAQIPISEIVSSGVGLGFIIFPEAIAQLPVPQLWSALFFLTLLSLGIDTVFGALETLVAGLSEAFPHRLKFRRVHVTGGICLFCFLLSIPYTTRGGDYLVQLLDWYAASFSVLLIGCLECMVISWIYATSISVCSMGGSRLVSLHLPPAQLRQFPYAPQEAHVLSLFIFHPPSYVNFRMLHGRLSSCPLHLPPAQLRQFPYAPQEAHVLSLFIFHPPSYVNFRMLHGKLSSCLSSSSTRPATSISICSTGGSRVVSLHLPPAQLRQFPYAPQEAHVLSLFIFHPPSYVNFRMLHRRLTCCLSSSSTRSATSISVALILSLFMYDPPSYGAYVYPFYAKVVGILMAVLMTLPIPVMMIYQVAQRDGTIMQRLKHASDPSPDRGPARTENRLICLERERTQQQIFMKPMA